MVLSANFASNCKIENETCSIFGEVSTSQETTESYNIEHLQLIGNQLRFTFRTKDKKLIEVQAIIEGEEIKMDVYGTENYLGSFTLFKQD